MVRYDRAPSDKLLALLQAPLAPLLHPWVVADLSLDLQFREKDTVQLYCGLTSLLVANPTSDGFKVTAHKTYTQQACAKRLMRHWLRDEPGFADALAQYLGEVDVPTPHSRREGAVQAAWMSVCRPWIPIDREGVLGYASTDDRNAALDSPVVRAAWEGARDLCARQKWATMKPLGTSNEVDQIAVAPDGSLVLVELKFGGASDVYQAPIQALRYVWEWHGALEAILEGLEEVSRARSRLGLSPKDIPEIKPRMRWALAVGQTKSSSKVLSRLATIRDIANGHRPPGVPELELWGLDEDGSPQEL